MITNFLNYLDGCPRQMARQSFVEPVSQDKKRGVAQPGRALRSGRRGRRFKSCHPDQKHTIKIRLDA